MGLGERIKPWMYQALTRDTRPDSNSRTVFCHQATPLQELMTLPFAFKTHPYQENIILSSHVVISAIHSSLHVNMHI